MTPYHNKTLYIILFFYTLLKAYFFITSANLHFFSFLSDKNVKKKIFSLLFFM